MSGLRDDGDPATVVEEEASIRLQAAHLLHALEIERQEDRRAQFSIDDGGKHVNEFDMLLLKIEELSNQLHDQDTKTRQEKAEASKREAELHEMCQLAESKLKAAQENIDAMRADALLNRQQNERYTAELKRLFRESIQCRKDTEIKAEVELKACKANYARILGEKDKEATQLRSKLEALEIQHVTLKTKMEAITAQESEHLVQIEDRNSQLKISRELVASLEASVETLEDDLGTETSRCHAYVTQIEANEESHAYKLMHSLNQAEKEAQTELEMRLATLNSEAEAKLIEAVKKAKKEESERVAVAEDRCMNERKKTELEHAAIIDKLRSESMKLHDRAISIETGLQLHETRAAEAMAKAAATESNLKAFKHLVESDAALQKQHHQKTIKDLRLAQQKHEGMLRAEIVGLNQELIDAQAISEKSAKAAIEQLKKEHEQEFGRVKSLHEQELANAAAEAKSAREALVLATKEELSAYETQAESRHNERLAECAAKLQHHSAINSAANKIQNAVRRYLLQLRLGQITRELRIYMRKRNDVSDQLLKSLHSSSSIELARQLATQYQNHVNEVNAIKKTHSIQLAKLTDGYQVKIEGMRRLVLNEKIVNSDLVKAKNTAMKECEIFVENAERKHATEREEWHSKSIHDIANAVAKAESRMSGREKHLNEMHAKILESEKLAFKNRLSILTQEREKLTGEVNALKADHHRFKTETTTEQAAAVHTLKIAHRKNVDTLVKQTELQIQALKVQHLLEIERIHAMCADQESFMLLKWENEAERNASVVKEFEMKIIKVEEEVAQQALEKETEIIEACNKVKNTMVQAQEETIESLKVSTEAEIKAANMEAEKMIQEAKHEVDRSKIQREKEMRSRIKAEVELAKHLVIADERKVAWGQEKTKLGRAHQREIKKWKGQHLKSVSSIERLSSELENVKKLKHEKDIELDMLRGDLERLHKEKHVNDELAQTRISKLNEALSKANNEHASFTRDASSKIASLQDQLTSLEVKRSEEKNAYKFKITSISSQLENALLDVSCLRNVVHLQKQIESGANSDASPINALGRLSQDVITCASMTKLPIDLIRDDLNIDQVQQLMHQRQRHMLMQRQIVAERQTHDIILEKVNRQRESLQKRVSALTNELKKKSSEILQIRKSCRAKVEQLQHTFDTAAKDIIEDRDESVQRLLGVERDKLSSLKDNIHDLEQELSSSHDQVKLSEGNAAAEREVHEKEMKKVQEKIESMHQTLMSLMEAFNLVCQLEIVKDARGGKILEQTREHLSHMMEQSDVILTSKVSKEPILLLTPKPKLRWL